jgi:heme exporter protein B
MNRSAAIFIKELQSEARTRHAISAMLLFVVTAVVIAVFASGDEPPGERFAAGLLWMIIFFAAMVSLGRSFVSETERGTDLLLRISTTPGAVYFGKLLFNILLLVVLDGFGAALYLFMGELPPVGDPAIFSLALLLGSVGLAGAMTIISAIISRAGNKNALLPVLSFPIVFPLLLLAIETTEAAFGPPSAAGADNIGLMTAYCGIVITASYLLFDFVWEE